MEVHKDILAKKLSPEDPDIRSFICFTTVNAIIVMAYSWWLSFLFKFYMTVKAVHDSVYSYFNL
jgi:hypothetical protein